MEDDIFDSFREFGDIQNMQVNRDRRTGLIKGYALIEYGERGEAQDAINSKHGRKFFGKELKVDFAYVKAAE